MRHTPRAKLQLRLVNAAFVLLFLVTVGLLQWLGHRYSLRFDWTDNARYTLSKASVDVLKTLKGPVHVTAFTAQPAVREHIRDFIGRYQRYKPDITLSFVDPDTRPDLVRDAGIRVDGELLIDYGKARDTVDQLTETAVTDALTRLGRRGERLIVFLQGHGERSPDGQADYDLSAWARQLKQRGFKIGTLYLSESPTVPQNTAVLVIAAPRTRLLPGEVKAIEAYLNRGGNLLWLADPGPTGGLEKLAEDLGIEMLPGTVIDPDSQLLTGNAAAIAIARYGQQPIVRGLDLMTVLPVARAISITTAPGWTASVILDTPQNAWADTGPAQGAVRYVPGRDIPGPLNIAVALTRDHGAQEQRVAVFGDANFVSNRFLNTAGNLDLAMHAINWLSHDDAYVNIPARITPDRQLNLSPLARNSIAIGFLILLPLALALSGVWVWVRRRRR